MKQRTVHHVEAERRIIMRCGSELVFWFRERHLTDEVRALLRRWAAGEDALPDLITAVDLRVLSEEMDLTSMLIMNESADSYPERRWVEYDDHTWMRRRGERLAVVRMLGNEDWYVGVFTTFGRMLNHRRSRRLSLVGSKALATEMTEA